MRTSNKTDILQLDSNMIMNVLHQNSSLKFWSMWLQTSRRMKNIAMLPPIRANILYRTNQFFVAVQNGHIRVSDVSRLILDLQGTYVIMNQATAFMTVQHMYLVLQQNSTTTIVLPQVSRLILSRTFDSLTINMPNISWFGSLTNLRSLTLKNLDSYGWDGLRKTDYSAIKGVIQLEKLVLHRVSWDASIWQSLVNLTDLSLLEIIQPGKLDLNALTPLVNLKTLYLYEMSATTSIPVVTKLPELRLLVLISLSNLTSIPILSSSTQVKKYCCPKVLPAIPDDDDLQVVLRSLMFKLYLF